MTSPTACRRYSKAASRRSRPASASRRRCPLFSRVHWLFPPVDFEFEDPPYLLVISPRDRIVEESATLLRSDLTLEEAQRLESDAEAKSDNVSALVVPTGGIGAYPAIIEPTDDYLSALQVASHEWMHDYLYFQPLGARYFANDTLRTINETVADIVGTEMGSMAEARVPARLTYADAGAAPTASRHRATSTSTRCCGSYASTSTLCWPRGR